MRAVWIEDPSEIPPSNAEIVSGKDPDPRFEAFADLCRNALLHLYEPAYLQTHPLAQLVDTPAEGDARVRGKALLQGFLRAIRALRPANGTPSDSRAWRTYQLLELRYIEGLSATAVAERLAIGKTQYHRDHARSLSAVASILWERWNARAALEHPAVLVSRHELAQAEVDQVASEMQYRLLDLSSALGEVCEMLRPLGAENGVRFAFRSNPNLPPIYADRIALRQVLLILINVGIQWARNGTLEVAITRQEERLALELTAASDRGVAPGPAQPTIDLEAAQRLAQAIHGNLELADPTPALDWHATLTFSVARQPTVLVMDNHPDFIGLATRYLTEHGWRVVGALDVPQAQSLATELRPNVILMDIMIPGQDGWDLLFTLKSRAETQQIPVIVCSILYDDQVARSLGADGYLPKPVTQQALLQALAPWR